MKITTLTTYSATTADQIRRLLTDLSRSGKDKGEIPESWFQAVIDSPWHDLLLALDDAGQIVGMASLSVILDPGNRQNAFLMDFVTASSARGQGIGSALWDAVLAWSRAKGCKNLEFTSGRDRVAAHEFYQHRGAEIYDTDYFRYKLDG